VNEQVYRRVLRRETHRPRTVAAIIVAVALIALAAAGAWLAVDRAARRGAVAGIDALSDPRIATAVGIVAGVLALVLILYALLPGRIRRRALSRDRLALLIDDRVVANGVADAVARACDVPRTRVSALVERRRVTVRVTPTSGVPTDEAMVRTAAEAALANARIPLAVAVRVNEKGAIA